MSSSTPALRETEHFYFRYSDFNDSLETFLDSKEGWRNHVINFALGWLRDEGLIDRAITRDLDWGIELPVPLDPNNRHYAAILEWAKEDGNEIQAAD